MAVENKIILEFVVGGGVSPDKVIEYFQDKWYEAPFPLRGFEAKTEEIN